MEVVLWDEDADIINIAMTLFTAGNDFALKNEVLHNVDEEEQEPPACGAGLVQGKHQTLNDSV